MNDISTIKRYVPRKSVLFIDRLDPSFRINERSGVLFQWVRSFFTHELETTRRPILILSGNNDLRRRNAASRAGRYYELMQSWRYMVPLERVLPVMEFDCEEICEAILENDDDDLENLGLLDSSYFQKNLRLGKYLVIFEDLHLMPSNQGRSFYRFLLSRLGKTLYSFPLPLIINDSRGVNGLQRQFQKEWSNILPILEQHSIQLEL
jgi:hypothetical protein